MQTMLEKACQTLAGENNHNHNMASASSYNNMKGSIGNNQQGVLGHQDLEAIKDFTSLGFPSFHDLNIYGQGGGGGDHHHHIDLHHSTFDNNNENNRHSSIDVFIHNPSTNDDSICLGNPKKRPSPYISSGNGKGPLLWSDDLRLQDLGSNPTTNSCHDIQIGQPPSTSPVLEESLFETKPMSLNGDPMMGEKGSKLERPSPRRLSHVASSDRMSNPVMSMSQGRSSSPFG